MIRRLREARPESLRAKRSKRGRRSGRLEALETRWLMATLANFDTSSSAAYSVWQSNAAVPAPLELPGGALPMTGEFLRIGSATANTNNSVAFDRTDAGAFDRIVADFDFRVTPTEQERGDGFAFALLNTANFGATGPASAGGPAEEPNLAGSLGVGFDTYENPGTDGCWNCISVHFNGALVEEVHEEDTFDIAGGLWHHARIIVDMTGPTATVTVEISPIGQEAFTAIDHVAVPGLSPYEARAYFAARSGGIRATQDVDNLNVQYLDADEAVFSLGAKLKQAREDEGSISLDVYRVGDLSGTDSVDIATSSLTAQAGQDFESLAETLTFAPGEAKKTVTINLLDDDGYEEDEDFLVGLGNAYAGAVVGGPGRRTLQIVDDERGRDLGDFGEVISLPSTAIHAIMLVTGDVLYWDRAPGGHEPQPRLLDPVTGVSRNAAEPPAGYHAFCSGYAQLPDGRIFVAGGHDHVDYIGQKFAAIYDPFADTWTSLPDMNAGRWYPTVLALPNGEVLVINGTIDYGVVNLQPQIAYQDAAGAWHWRDIDVSQDQADNFAAHNGGLYPKSWVAPNGKVFMLGANNQTWWLDTSPGVTNPWTRGPDTISNITRNDYGTGTMFAPGKILITGGGQNGPTAAAEWIDLNEANPVWRSAGQLPDGPRRQHNGTALPDGSVLITGGTHSWGSSNLTNPANSALRWTPPDGTGQGTWKTLDVAEIPRAYHSTIILLPDGRLISAGSGEPASTKSFDQRNGEIYSPWYLFRENRPEITSAPQAVTYGQQFKLTYTGGSQISQVVMISLNAITHTLEQSARRIPLSFTVNGNTIVATAPANVTDALRQYYMVFLVDDRDAVSAAQFVQLTSTTAHADDVALNEGESGDTFATVTVRLNAASRETVTVNYATSNGTATAGSDYEAAAGTLTFAPGVTQQSFQVRVFGDTLPEGSETFVVRLTNSSHAALVDATATVTLIADEAALKLLPLPDELEGQAENARLVEKLYQQVLGRSPELGGWTYWVNRLTNGTATIGTVAAGIFESNERIDPILKGFYQDLLLREIDPSGLEFWRDVWRDFGGPEPVVIGIIASPEFFQSAGGTNEDWVKELYRRLLDREADEGGLTYWTERLNRAENPLTRQQVVEGFTDSAENRRNLIQGWFVQYLGRAATNEEQAKFVTQMAAGSSQRDIQMQLIESEEYRASVRSLL